MVLILEVFSDSTVLNVFKYIFRKKLLVDPEIVWHPKIDFVNLMKSEPSKVFGDTGSGYLKYKSGQMMYVEALQMKFSCHFDFTHFPFESHTFCIEYGSVQGNSDHVVLNPAIVTYGNRTTGDAPFELNDLPFPFHIKIESLPTSRKFNPDRKKTYDYTGMCFKIDRTTRGQLLSGYYYPTASFAFLSTISYLINPDVVSIYYS